MILYFADTRFPIERANGMQTMATCHALAARGHQIGLVVRPDTCSPARDPFEFYDFPRLPNLEIEAIPGPRHVAARRAQFLLTAMRRMITLRPDVVCTRDLGLAAFLLQLPVARRSPIVYESHGVSVVVSAEMPALLGNPALLPSSRKMQRLERRERRVWQHADAYVTITHALADELAARYGPRERVFVVPDGAKVATAAITPPAPPRHGAPLAGYAGHLYPWKGVDIFVQALARAPGLRGLIVGGHPREADYARVQRLIGELKLADRVELTGLVAPRDVAQRLAAATMLVLPNAKSAISERYTSPLKLFEYLTMGRPIIASDLPSIREVLTHDETAWLVDAGDAQLLASAMTILGADEDLAGRLGRAAFALAPQYSWERRGERLDRALATAIGR